MAVEVNVPDTTCYYVLPVLIIFCTGRTKDGRVEVNVRQEGC